MKEKIEQLANGIFEYDRPYLIISEEIIDIIVESGKTYKGNFTICCSDNTELKGLIYSSNRLMTCNITTFIGTEIEVEYEFLGNNIESGVTIEGAIQVVSNYEEVELPFKVKIESPYCLTSLGKMKDLFQFANLAQADWTEALSLFQSKDFERVFLHNEPKVKVIYEKLKKSRNINQALEELLITIHKKSKVNVFVDKKNLEYNIKDDMFMEKLIVNKENWGYVEIRISSDTQFIKLERKKILADNFIGSTYQLEYVIDPKYMRLGNNYGNITLKTVYQTIVIPIICKKTNFQYKRDETRKELKKSNKAFLENYLQFRTGKINVEKYKNLTVDSIYYAKAYGHTIFCDLMQVHHYIISGKIEDATILLEKISENEKELKSEKPELYAAFLYLNALINNDKVYIGEIIKKIKKIYEKEISNWKYLWFLLYLDEKYEKNIQLKFKHIQEQFKLGCTSPIMYFEACMLINQDASLLIELGKFELQFISFGIKNNYIQKEAREQITYLVSRMKYFNHLVYRILEKMYEQNQTKDILSAICSLLIKGNQVNKKYFKWFRLGVLEQLRITELYEYYMYTFNDEDEKEIDPNVLLYFIYNSNLNDKKKAILYANIIKNKEKNQTIYYSYSKQMEIFVLKQIELKNISNNLSVIYKEILTKDMINLSTAKALPSIAFKHQIVCNNPNIVGVLVTHDELMEEVYVPLVDKIADIDVFTDNMNIFLVDNYENRYATTIEYTIHKLMNSEEFLPKCFDLNLSSKLLLLNLGEKAQRNQRYDEKSLEIRRQIIKLEGITGNYLRDYTKDLITYYYDNYDPEVLESYLLKIDLDLLGFNERNKIIEIIIIRGIQASAMEALNKYGFEGISIKRLFNFCSKIIRVSEFEKNDLLVSLSHYVFKTGRFYDENILKYLSEFYYGTTNEMYEIWKAAKETKLNISALEERLLAQMLFSESYVKNSCAVFVSYYEKEPDSIICKAFLSYSSYKYLIKERVIQAELFKYIKLIASESDIARIAALKHFSNLSEFSSDDVKFIEDGLEFYVRKGIILPFYKKFVGKLKIPHHIIDKEYVEYISDPKNVISINYVLEGEEKEDYQIEIMKNIFHGIHVKEFLLFYNEKLQYYITEKDAMEVIIGISGDIELDDDVIGHDEKRYDALNMILFTKEMKDEKTLIESIKTYAINNYAVEKLFKEL